MTSDLDIKHLIVFQGSIFFIFFYWAFYVDTIKPGQLMLFFIFAIKYNCHLYCTCI